MSELLKINVNDVLKYDYQTGAFTWASKRGCRAAGQAAGSKRQNGYVSIHVDGKRHYAHRLAFLCMTGMPPAGVVDHINGDRSDNRWANLRDVSQSENMANRRGAQKNSQTGMIGASPHVGGGYVAQIRRNKQYAYLGYFKTPEEAHQAYMRAANECR